MNHSITVDISSTELNDIVTIINKYDVDTSVGDVPLTEEEVVSKPELLKYLATSFIEDGRDVGECWNSDGFCEFEDYR